jgi:UDP-3-O-[3-hydroxymyristoyl] glucosamine N-acyltransferase
VLTEQQSIRLADLAVRFGLSLRGDPDVRVERIATLVNAEPGSLSFLANPKYRKHLRATRASAVLVTEQDAEACRCAALIDRNPYLAYARIADLLHPTPGVVPGRHSSAVIDPRARVAESARIAEHCVIEADAEIGERVSIGPGCTVGRATRVGADSRLVARVTLCHEVVLGERCLVHPGAVVGSDGFGFAPNQGTWVKVAQIGTVRVGNDVEIGANTAIDRGAIDDTVIEDGVKLDNLIQVGHNVRIGAHTIIAGCTGISGSTIIGSRCMVGGMVGFAGHLSVADDVVITGMSLVSASIHRAGSYSSAIPVVETKRWRRLVGRIRRLDVRHDTRGDEND